MQDFTGKIVLVTGASSGIGRAAVKLFAERGAEVIAAARREDRGNEAVEQARNTGGKAQFFPLDVTDEGSVDRLFGRIRSEYGRLDGAFNNAGIEAEAAPLPDASVQVFDEVFRTNVRGTWLCMKQELAIMREQRAGAIVNTSSIAGLIGYADSAAYVGSKHAIIGMTKSAGLDLAALGIRVNCICPGATRSDMSARWAERVPGGEDAMAQAIPMLRLASPEEQAKVAAFLLSAESSYMTGATVVVDGGLSVP